MLSLWAVLFFSSAYATPIDSYEFVDKLQEQRFYELTNELRCPKCQNQSIADSNAPIAEDLRREVHKMVVDGADNQTVIDFMLARYGDFVLYTPRFEGKTLILWLGPLVLLLIGLLVLITVVRGHRSQAVTTDVSASDSASEELTQEQRKKLDNVLGGKQ
ncbi:hypothetical protein ACH42_14205 [Endozoicomonas sp. (ex Bugula neritina AB1)]|nr:hypothetical protein ACH42_14205 [Endozoicomonas sp. (ex Bugula neritina AB1)]